MHPSTPINRNNESFVGTTIGCPNGSPEVARPVVAPTPDNGTGTMFGIPRPRDLAFRSAAPLSRHRSAGFTITETLIAVAILLILVTGIMTTYVFSIYSFQAITNYVQLHVNGRTAVNQFLKDMRGVCSVVSFATNGPLVVTVATNYNGNFLTTTVTYTFSSSGHTLSRSDPTSTSLLGTNVGNAVFTMYDRVGSNTVALNLARAVQLDLTMSNQVVNLRETEDYLSARTVMRNTP